MSIGGRFGFNDCGETANTHIALLDYQPALQGHLSAACCHMANISYRLGKQSAPEAIGETIRGNRELSDAFDRCGEYLRENGVDLESTPATLGPWVTFDPKQERFVQDFAAPANALLPGRGGRSSRLSY